MKTLFSIMAVFCMVAPATANQPALMFGLEPSSEVVSQSVESFGLCANGQCQVRQPVRQVARRVAAPVFNLAPVINRQVTHATVAQTQQVVEYVPQVSYVEVQTPVRMVTRTKLFGNGLFSRIRAKFRSRSTNRRCR